MDFLTNGVVDKALTWNNTLIVVCSALVIGFIISSVYMFNYKEKGYSSSFILSLIMLPTIISMIILLIGSDVARAFSLAGAFSLVRFRSTPGDSKDISYVFFALGIGLACGMGYIGYAFIFTVIICLVLIVLGKVKFGASKQKTMQLKIVVPEDMNYEGIFEQILGTYTTAYQLEKIKTTEFGSLFELGYRIRLKEETKTKEMIDALRCQNGNLKIILHLANKQEASEL